MLDLHLQHNIESITCLLRLINQITDTQKISRFSPVRILSPPIRFTWSCRSPWKAGLLKDGGWGKGSEWKKPNIKRWDSIYITFSKWHNYRDRGQISSYQGLGNQMGECDYKWTAGESFIVLREWFYILIVMVTWLSKHTYTQSMHVKTGEIKIKFWSLIINNELWLWKMSHWGKLGEGYMRRY